jgi:hypothetical protein
VETKDTAKQRIDNNTLQYVIHVHCTPCLINKESLCVYLALYGPALVVCTTRINNKESYSLPTGGIPVIFIERNERNDFLHICSFREWLIL